MRGWRSGAFVLVLTLVGPAIAALPGFGSRVALLPHAKSPVLTLDLNADGIPDQVFLVSVASASKSALLAPDVKVLSSFWSSRPLGAHSARRALAIALGGAKGKFLITGYQGEGTDFFDTPIWQGSDPPLARGKRHGHDALLVGTEAGIDTTVYWNGRTLALYEPLEEP